MYAMIKGWVMNVEWIDDLYFCNNYWELWGLLLFKNKNNKLVTATFRVSLNTVALNAVSDKTTSAFCTI
jgi:ribulose bisphosphate carboxylase small subunit